VLLVCRFAVAPSDAPAFLARARRALELLTAADGALGGELGRSVDEPDRWVLAVRFASVDAYRRALSPFPVREHVVPLLSEALVDEPSTFETLVSAESGAAVDLPSLLVEHPAGEPG
jgi:quinol monooxygenase YgiN